MTKITEETALITIFGGTGDLANRKLYPAIYRLYAKGFLKENFAVIGTARRQLTDALFRERVASSIASIADKSHIQAFVSHFYYRSHDVTNKESYKVLLDLSNELDTTYHLKGNRVFFLAMAPTFFNEIAIRLKSEGLVATKGYQRLMIEKPFGHDLASAQELNDALGHAFNENQIYRIDHYLGKEMVQNVSAIRFANPMIEALWNNRHISNVQVTLAEELGVEERGGYYDNSGALRDMFQNHILQVVSLLLMDFPLTLDKAEIRAEKVRLLRSLDVPELDVVNNLFVPGQYDANPTDPQTFKAYRSEENVSPTSTTETYVAGKLTSHSDRWNGVPIYIRTGKRLSNKKTNIVIEFKNDRPDLFDDSSEKVANTLVIEIAPNESITLNLNVKVPGLGLATQPTQLQTAADAVDQNAPEAYEKVIHDCLRGDATYFSHWDEVALSWQLADRIYEGWKLSPTELPNYDSGSAGPIAADELLARDGHTWYPLS